MFSQLRNNAIKNVHIDHHRHRHRAWETHHFITCQHLGWLVKLATMECLSISLKNVTLLTRRANNSTSAGVELWTHSITGEIICHGKITHPSPDPSGIPILPLLSSPSQQARGVRSDKAGTPPNRIRCYYYFLISVFRAFVNGNVCVCVCVVRSRERLSFFVFPSSVLRGVLILDFFIWLICDMSAPRLQLLHPERIARCWRTVPSHGKLSAVINCFSRVP